MKAAIVVAVAMLFAPTASHASQSPTAVALSGQFVPPVIVIEHGQSLSFTNADTQTHSLTATTVDANGNPIFDSGFQGIGQSGIVRGVDSLAPNHSGYSFACMMHPWMTGTLIVL
ncbi:MAG: cupredoxin domain-containing protein [Actinomycetota bacterium]